MATPKKATGSGAKCSISLDNTAWKEFASVSKLGPPNMTRGTIDVTDMNSYESNNQMKEFLTDFIEAEEMTIEGYVVGTDAGRDAAESAFYSGEEVYIKIDLPEAIGKSMTVTGMMTAYRPIGDISTDSGIAYSFSIKPTSKPTLAATGGS